jgi:hypothetical protein
MIQIGGAGHHLIAVSPANQTNMLKMTTALQIVCPFTTSLTKLGILCLFHEILARASSHYQRVIKATFGLVLTILIIQVIIPFANCKPFSHTWDPLGPGTCAFPGLNLWRYLSIPNIITTIIMVGIPLPALYNLNVSPATRLGLGLVFAVGITGVVAAIMRFQSFLSVRNFNDITFETINPLCWTIAESGIYLVAGVMPTLRPLVRKINSSVHFDKILSRTTAVKTWGSWGNKRGSKMMWGKPLPPKPATEATEKSMSETIFVEYVEPGEKSLMSGMGGMNSGKTSTADVRETMFSTQEQSVVCMLDR